MPALALPYADPVEIFRQFSAAPWAMLLHSAAAHPARGRFSYLLADPVHTIEAAEGITRINGTTVADDPFTALQRLLAQHPPTEVPGPAPFAGGAVGFIGYEAAAHYLECLPCRHGRPEGIPDIAFGIYDKVATYDHRNRRAWLSVCRPGADGLAHGLAARLSQVPASRSAWRPALWRSELSRADYLQRIGAILDYIRAGDIYQANFTQRFLAERPRGADVFAIFERLCHLSPAPFAAFLNCGPDLQIASASPERFLRLTAEGHIETRPIKGTAPRSIDAGADVAAMVALRSSIKDRAENLMIVDLMRNDLSRTARIGSVTVPVLFGIETFASVHHMVSVIEARLRPGLNAIDLLCAAFPGGSVTGAPKLRAMQIIDELEVAPRGPYCGSIAWIGFDGAMDSNIIIRTLIATQDVFYAQAGGGIVADSDPLAEHDEMSIKVKPLLCAVSGEENRCCG